MTCKKCLRTLDLDEKIKKGICAPCRGIVEGVKSLREIEKGYILHILKIHNYCRTYTATALKISIRTLRNKINQYRKEGTYVPYTDVIEARRAKAQTI